jgi:hypothetical protein
MSLQIAVAHTGQRLDADPVGFNSVEALKQWISESTEIPPEYQILLTPKGKHVKLQALLTEVGSVYPPFPIELMSCHRRRYLSTTASSQLAPSPPSLRYHSPNLSPPMTLPTRCPAIPICAHGRHSFKPAATGRSRSSRSPNPCPD